MRERKNIPQNTRKMDGRRTGLDERQQQIADRTGMVSCFLMLGISLAWIIGQLLWTGEVTMVLGETVIFLAGGIAYLAGNIRNGIWDRGGRKRGAFRNLLESVLFSGVFTVLYVMIILKKAKEGTNVAQIAVLFFAGIAVLCFLSLTILEKAAKRRREKQEENYLD